MTSSSPKPSTMNMIAWATKTAARSPNARATSPSSPASPSSECMSVHLPRGNLDGLDNGATKVGRDDSFAQIGAQRLAIDGLAL
jgi:hypothetical protein